MARNMGTLDRSARAILGLVLLACAYLTGAGSLPGIAAAVAGIVMLVTAAVGFCPLYRLVGLRSCKDC
ncbi:YgaP family membrane protein [Pukyongiella litopenaei]|uniref:DUF2892 domain-containing protein n=1 Tax=Pukyongiella litopenaei TaxID=2605946 RepID=A0A2S0MNM6_9RHOB|nr:DUF2892 domain-containing protein [Pukyongiella litopenaei]AVO37446.1 DUF2892 domain-containing protein [Pukyongiella litopenaei]